MAGSVQFVEFKMRCSLAMIACCI